MIKPHATRLMRSGEVVLWREGAIVWSGAVGAYVTSAWSLEVSNSRPRRASPNSTIRHSWFGFFPGTSAMLVGYTANH